MSRLYIRIFTLIVTIALTLTVFGSSSIAEPTTGTGTILWIRPYSNASNNTPVAYVMLTAPSNQCSNAQYFTIVLSDAAGQGMLAAAMTALTAGRAVALEISNSTGCTATYNGGPVVQSLYLH